MGKFWACRMVKKILLILILTCLLGTHKARAEYIVLAYVDFPPYEYRGNDGTPQGTLVTIVETVFERAGIELILKFLPFQRAFLGTKRGEIDGLFNFYRTESRLAFFDYTEPIIQNPLNLFVRTNAAIQFTTLEDLEGLTIGVMRGYTYGKAFDESPLFTREAGDTHQSNFTKLIHKRIDAYLCDRRAGIHIATENQMMAELKILPRPVIVMDGHIGFTKGRHRAVIRKINVVIAQMHQNGEIDQLIAP